MTDQIRDGGPAFPMPGLSGLPNGEFLYGDHGMSLRDYFAAKALQGWLASFAPEDLHPVPNDTADSVCKFSYALADAMLRAREADHD